LRRKLGKKVWQFFPYDAQNRLWEAQENAHRHHVQTIDKKVAIAPLFAHLQASGRKRFRIPPQLQQPRLPLHPFPEPAVVRQGPAVSEAISGQFYHISIYSVAFHCMLPRAPPVRRSRAMDCPQPS
jgi:hypothetical protein